jgi:FKBP-type peptidyl-prolyl cis-trans isomerase (trigger factor)
MSKKSKRKADARAVKSEETRTGPSDNTSEQKARKNKITVISAVAILVVIALTVGIVALVLNQKDFDYMKSDLSDYITISENDYKNHVITLKKGEITDADVERKIMALLYKSRADLPSNKGAEMYKVPISVGDTVGIYYRGYTVDSDGIEHDIDGVSNLLGDIEKLGIGSMAFIPGFEEGLIGAVPWNHQFNPENDIIKTGNVLPGDVMYISYTAVFPDGTTSRKDNERIDLSDENLDERYGAGFKAFFLSSGSSQSRAAIGKQIGIKLTDTVPFDYQDGTAVYFDMTINAVLRCESQPLTIDATFPLNYNEKSLRGLDVKFDVYIKSAVIYETPEYNEQFITDTLKISADDLKEYSGNSIEEKHRAYLLAEANAENEEMRKALIEEAMWEHYNSKVKIKKLPKGEVEEIYHQYYGELTSQYQLYYSPYYSSFGEFVRAYYNLSSSADWDSYINELAESVIVEKLIFYYIIRAEKLVPSDTEFQNMYNETVQEYLDYYVNDIYAEEIASLKTDAEKEARIIEIKEEMLDYYGEEYFDEIVYYDYALDKIIAFATVVTE